MRAVMKAKAAILGLALVMIFLFSLGSTLASADYTVTVNNVSGESVRVWLVAKSPYSFYSMQYIYSSPEFTPNGGTATYNVVSDHRSLCPGYLQGYNSNATVNIQTMGASGVIEDMYHYYCANLSFEVYKASDGTLHFRKK